MTTSPRISPRFRPRVAEVAYLLCSALWVVGCDAADAAQNQPQGSPAAVSPVHERATVAAASPSPSAKAAPAAREVEESATTAKPPIPSGPRVYAKARFVWVRGTPSTEVQWIGYLWTGGSVALRDEKAVSGHGCSQQWYPIEPRGWVCVDGERATLDADDPVVRAVAPYAAKLDTPWPHQYADVYQPVRRYDELPSREVQAAHEVAFDRHWERVLAARRGEAVHPSLLDVDVGLSKRPGFKFPELPTGLQEGRHKMRDRSTLAFVDSFRHDDRSFLLAADMSWVPRDRVKLYPRIEFQGLELNDQLKLPLALFRYEKRPGYRESESGFVATDRVFERLSHVTLTGKTKRVDDETFYETTRDGLWVKKRDAVIPEPRSKTPWGAPVGEKDTTDGPPRGRGTWVEASILGGWLVAFEGTRPVYVTMISAGRGGTPQGDRDPIETASTPTGWFPISGKFKTATMDSPVRIVHSDVPWTQNFSGPHALHGAYWHDDWGQLKSAGCVNVSPRDGKWLFEFTEPEVPEGWHGVRYVSKYGGATMFIVHE